MPNLPASQLLWWALKTIAAMHLFALAAQPVLFGQHFSGHPDALAWHAMAGEAVAWVALAQALLAVICWRHDLLRPLAAFVLVAIFAFDGLQLHLGYARVVGVHIPLGTALLAVSLSATLWLWFYARPDAAAWQAQR